MIPSKAEGGASFPAQLGEPAVCLDHESQRTLWSAGLGARLEPLLENIIGPPGTNFSWKDADGEMVCSHFLSTQL